MLDLLGRRAALPTLWELRIQQSLTFRALQEACEANPSLLNTRLRELREVGVVERTEGGYFMTLQDRELQAALQLLNDWAQRWAAQASGKTNAAVASVGGGCDLELKLASGIARKQPPPNSIVPGC